MTPVDEYRRRLQERDAQVAQLELGAARISNVRVVLAILFIVAAWWSTRPASFDYWWVAPLALFIGAVIYHSRLRRARSSRCSRDGETRADAGVGTRPTRDCSAA